LPTCPTFLAAYQPGSTGRLTKPSWKRWFFASAPIVSATTWPGSSPSRSPPTATVRQREITDEAVVVEQLVDLVREAAGLLGQATWFWAQTMNHEASRDISPM
jgi:hypothetical protein